MDFSVVHWGSLASDKIVRTGDGELDGILSEFVSDGG